MNILRFFYYIYYLGKQDVETVGILIFTTCVEDETNSLKAFDSAFVLCRLTAEVAAMECDLLEVGEIGFIVFIDGDDPVDDVSPIFEGARVANKEVIFVEDIQNSLFQLSNKENPGFFK